MSDRLALHVGCRFDWESLYGATAIGLVDPAPPAGGAAVSGADARVIRELWSAGGTEFIDLYGNRSRRFAIPAGRSSFTFDATVEMDAASEPHPTADDPQHLVADLPDAALHWLLSSRYCAVESFAPTAWELFGATPPGVARVQAVCDWIHGNVTYGVPSVETTTALEVLERRGGMCRDFAHLGVTFCRALNIPARYVMGYLPDIGIPGPYPLMDFHAWFEVFLGERWWTYDARFNEPRIGRLPIARGRDAVDVAMVTNYGLATLTGMTVIADEVPMLVGDGEAS